MQNKRHTLLIFIIAFTILYSSMGIHFNGFYRKAHAQKSRSEAVCEKKCCTSSQKQDEIRCKECKEESNCQLAENGQDLEDMKEHHPVSILSFNFIFYVIYKFKISDLLGLKD